MKANVGSSQSPEYYMRRALALARRASGDTRPNPLVGAVIVNHGEIVGRGWHHRAGLPHAEVEAISDAGTKAKGGEMYVTLEPCNHHGKTPPCSEAIIASGIKRVFVSMRDPNPSVAGGGVERLRSAGIDVQTGLLEESARELNCAWAYWVSTGLPYVVVSIVLSLDGKLAFAFGESVGSVLFRSRRQLSRLRHYLGCVLVDRDLSEAERTVVEAGRRDIQVVDVSLNSDFGETFAVLGKNKVQGVFCESPSLVKGLLLQGVAHRLLVYRVPVIIGARGRGLFDDWDKSRFGLPGLRLVTAIKAGSEAMTVYDVQRREG